MKTKIMYVLLLSIVFGGWAQTTDYGDNQPYASYWFVEDLLQWSPKKDRNSRFNISYVPLGERFSDSTTQLRKELSTAPGIISLVAPHPTSKHPAQGFPSVKQYAFPYWQYIDYFVQWGGSAAEGIIVPPLATWTDAAHRNGVRSIGTVFFPPNVYGGKEEWVYQFLQQREDGSFPVADKLIEVARTYGFDGWFINQETYNLKRDAAELMVAFIAYYRTRASLKLVWYDAMIDDGRVIWQDELNDHNQVFFQKGTRSMSDVFFINFRYSATNLEDSKAMAGTLGRSEWDLFAGIDVQAKSYKTLAKWDALYQNGRPSNTSIGLYWPNSTFDISKTKEPEEVYANEQKFWNGGPSVETRFGETKWEGFAPYFPARSVLQKLPFKTNFNYGLGRFYNEKGKTIANREWHNLSIQDVLPTWQWQSDSTKVKPTFSFSESYEGGSSLLFETYDDAEISLYKTNIALDKSVTFEVVAKSDTSVRLQFYCQLSNGEVLSFPLKPSGSWKKTVFRVAAKTNTAIVSTGLQTMGKGNAHLGEISTFYKKEKKLPAPEFSIEVFPKGDKAEVYLHFEDTNAAFHNIYSVSGNNKVWLGKTPSKDYYVANAPLSNGFLHLMVEPISVGGNKGKAAYQKIRIEK